MPSLFAANTSFFAAATAGCIGLMALLGWYSGLDLLTTYADGRPAISITTALLLAVAGAAMAMVSQLKAGRPVLSWAARAGGLFVLAMGSISLFEPLLSAHMDVHGLGDPHALIPAMLAPGAPASAGHPSALSGVTFMFAGALLLAASRVGDLRHVQDSQWLAIAILLIAFQGLVGHLFQAHDFYQAHRGLGSSLPASVGFLLLAVAALSLHPRHGPMAVVTAPTAGGRMLRWLLPTALGALVLIEWLVVEGHQHDWYDDQFATALSTLCASLAIGMLLFGVARRIDRREAKTRSAHELLETMFSNIHTMLAFLDCDFRFIRVNEAYAAAVGRKPRFFVGKGHFELYPDAENEAIFRKVVATGQDYIAYARPFAHPDRPDETTYWDWVLSPVKDELGAVRGLLLSLNDVTDRKRSEDERLRAEREFRQLFDAASDALFVLDPDGAFIAVNETACKRLGYSRAELLRMGPASIDSPEFRERIPERMLELQQAGQIVFEAEHCTRDGRRIPVEVSAQRIEFVGQPAILSIARDISTRKAMERMQRVGEAQTRALLNSLRETSILLAPDGRVLAINQTGARRLKSTPEAIVGRNIYELLPPEVAEARRVVVAQAIAERRPVEYQDQRAEYFFDHTIYPILDEHGEVEQVAVHAINITDKVRALGVEKIFHEIDRQIQLGLRIEDLLGHVCEEVAHLFSLRVVWVGAKRPDRRIDILAIAGPDEAYRETLEAVPPRWDDSPMGQGPAGSAIRTGQARVFNADDKGFQPWRQASAGLAFHAVYSIPLAVEGEIFGAILYHSDQELFFDDPRVAGFLDDIANRLCVAIGFAQQQERMQLLSTALSAAGNSVFITDAQGRIQWVNRAFTELTGYSAEEAYMQTPRMLKSGRQDAAYYTELWQTIQSGQVWSRDAMEKGKDGRLFTVQQTITPIFNAEGRITHFVAIQEDITEKKAVEERIQHMAYFDALTDLPNRALFFDRLHQAITQAKRHAQAMAVCFLDLDRFKLVNDKLGHEAGDLLLQGVARRLEACVRESDTVARLGGDEFTLILANLNARGDASVVAEKVLAALSEPFDLAGQPVRTGTSIGIAFYPEHGGTPDELVKAADDAMYLAKSQGRGSYRFSGAQ